MPRSEKSNRAFATTSSSCRTLTAEKTGVVCVEVGAGLALCAATQIEQDEASLWLGWLWVDSAAAVQNIKDTHSQADHRTHKRIASPVTTCGDSFPASDRLSPAYNVIRPMAIPGTLL